LSTNLALRNCRQASQNPHSPTNHHTSSSPTSNKTGHNLPSTPSNTPISSISAIYHSTRHTIRGSIRLWLVFLCGRPGAFRLYGGCCLGGSALIGVFNDSKRQ
jgi:hypothetical protein